MIGSFEGSPVSANHDHSRDAHPRRLMIAFAITGLVLVAEIVGAAVTGSLALLADAGHMLTDFVGLGVALVAARLMRRPASDRRTWGYLRSEVLAATVQAAILLVVGILALIEGARRLIEPEPVASGWLILFGAIGLGGNVISMLALAPAKDANLNMRAAFLEVANDALGSVAVIASAVTIALTGWVRADAIAGILIAVLILPRAWLILRESGNVLLETTPSGLVLDEVRGHILGIEHVTGVHDIHASRISTTLPVLTAHVVVRDECFRDGDVPRILRTLQECLHGHFDVEHSTFQIEPESHAVLTDHGCRSIEPGPP